MTTQATTQPFLLKTGGHSAPSPDQMRALALVLKGDSQWPPEVPPIEVCGTEAAYLRWAIAEGFSIEDSIRRFTASMPCGSPIILAAIRGGNDRMGRSARGDARRLRTFTAELQVAVAGTKGSDALEQRRRYALIDWSLRSATPEMLERSTSLAHLAPNLRDLAEIVNDKTLHAARVVLDKMRAETWRVRDAAWAELRKKQAEVAAAAVAEVAAVAVVAVVAEVAVAVAAVAAVAEVADVAAVAAVADVAVAVAAVASVASVAAVAAVAVAAVTAVAEVAFTPDVMRRAAAEVRNLQAAGHGWSRQFDAAKAIFREAIDSSDFVSTFADLTDRHDSQFRDLLLKLCAMKGAK